MSMSCVCSHSKDAHDIDHEEGDTLCGICSCMLYRPKPEECPECEKAQGKEECRSCAPIIGTWENPCCLDWNWITGCRTHSPPHTERKGLLGLLRDYII